LTFSGGMWGPDTTFKIGTSSNRPQNPGIGQDFFDVTLGKPIWFNGSHWVDANGNES